MAGDPASAPALSATCGPALDRSSPASAEDRIRPASRLRGCPSGSSDDEAGIDELGLLIPGSVKSAALVGQEPSLAVSADGRETEVEEGLVRGLVPGADL